MDTTHFGAESERPRERFTRLGSTALSNAELIAILLGTGTAGHTSRSIADRLAQRPLRTLASACPRELALVKGVGQAQALRIAAAFELGKRVAQERSADKPVIGDATQAAALLLPRYGLKRTETFGILCLDSRSRLLSERVVSDGGVARVSVSPCDVYRIAILDQARQILVFHNHPSGDPAPSFEDRALTDRLAEAGRSLAIPLVAHIILGGTTFFELRPTS